MRTFRIKLRPEIAETKITGVDLPDIIEQNLSNRIGKEALIYYIKTGEVIYDQIAKLNSSYKNYIHIYKIATVERL